ncbi:hypothetical protein AN639_09305 [Candidatus Epulonipiscium fishelsonii]|uniref:Uncharacterized protein n=1 Tax=Candidatus Epulonipiscium fishelsonii TaxID=77094 RepID=A0ACC8XDN1_9FIRM|nr:hypothetical protein AN639_09305 [Epulopiscium sp. SCG-B05WGA-EpuloA1]ONI41039.1 hypothetical protein AN396_04590 [Epulopiscium sp. SCG-B11WGA-EpuloA1]
MIVAGKVDKGKKRSNNQDNLFISNECIGPLPNLYIIADGMGGHNAGDTASKRAIEEFCLYAQTNYKLQISKPEDIINFLKRATSHTNYIVYNEASKNIELRGMGTTLTVATIIKSKMYIAHVGDSRIYFLSEKNIKQITTDHSIVAEMSKSLGLPIESFQNHPNKNVITRAIGIDNKIKIDVISISIKYIEYFLMCSDGLNNMLSDSTIHHIVYNNKNRIDLLIESLIQEANNKGGTDNIAVILGEVNKKC